LSHWTDFPKGLGRRRSHRSVLVLEGHDGVEVPAPRLTDPDNCGYLLSHPLIKGAVREEVCEKRKVAISGLAACCCKP